MHNQFKTQKFKHLMLAVWLAMGPRDLNSAPYSPVHCSSHSMTSFQSSELTELPVVENGQLFAQRAHSACTARAQRTVRPPYRTALPPGFCFNFRSSREGSPPNHLPLSPLSSRSAEKKKPGFGDISQRRQNNFSWAAAAPIVVGCFVINIPPTLFLLQIQCPSTC